MALTNDTNRTLWLDYLRSFITVLVIAHHASLAYTTFATFDHAAYINSTNPIVDSKRWIGLDRFENFNDIFFMFLMFFISGLFIIRSIERKGPITFIKDRTKRLFIPFLLIGTSAMLVSYFPAYYIAHQSTNMIDYVIDFFTTERWPVGPPWFIWVLFLFNLILAVCYSSIKKILKNASNYIGSLANRPLLFFSILSATIWILYVPIAYHIGAGTWTGWGPFDFQLSRIAAYFGFFLLGVIVGASDFNNTVFSRNSGMITHWKYWMILALLLYVAITVNSENHFLEMLVIENKMPEFTAWMIYYSFYVACCVASCMAFIGIFRSQVKNSKRWWDSLSDNAYLMYLVHYIFIVWGQFGLLTVDVPAFIKFLMVFGCALFASWVLSFGLKKFNVIKKYL